jgi:phosphoribosylamine--glycine ligase
MKILVLGAGGREHALVWRLASDPDVTEVLAAPGNPGMAGLARCLPVDLARPEDALALARREAVDLTVVGPEAPLTLGLADTFRAAGLLVLGPGTKGALLEGSKVHAKHFMARHGIPTARFVVCDDPDEALGEVARHDFARPLVVKADGLAAGKGVVVAETRAEAEGAVRAAMLDKSFGEAGARLVLEECLVGPEVSAFYLCDGERAVALSTAQDHKRIFDGDRGPNTGGMGAFSPSPLVSAEIENFTKTRIVDPLLAGMREIGEPYIGFLYVSLMLTGDGPQVIEFNVRFGDPEAQVVLPRIGGRFAEALRTAAAGRLGDVELPISDARTVGVVIASRGYPASAESGQPIDGLDAAQQAGALVFHAGTKLDTERIVTAGGRVLTVVGRAARFEEAMALAYRAVEQVRFDGMQCRHDIGMKALAEEARKAAAGPAAR